MKESNYSMRELANTTIVGLSKAYDFYQKRMEELTSKHETDIDLIYNGDDPADLGDWTDRELHGYKFAIDRATKLYEAIQIIKEERVAWELEDERAEGRS